MKQAQKGFTLIELVIVVAVLVILVSLSYPSFAGFVRKTHRADAQVTLLEWANRQEIWRADHPDYSSDLAPGNTEHYTFSMVSTPTSFTLTATAIGVQANDKEAGVDCPALTINQAGVPGPAGHEKCWSK